MKQEQRELGVSLRIREIADGLGTRLRVTAEDRHAGSLVILERSDLGDGTRALLDHYGAEVLRAFLMAARLSVSAGLPDEIVGGAFATQFRLVLEPAVTLAVTQDGGLVQLEIPASVWDRLYAELCLISAHAGEGARAQSTRPVRFN